MYSEHEIAQREAVLRRMRRMLERQRGRFQEYLTILETEQRAAEANSLDALEQQVELETTVLEQIIETQKTIAPLERMYLQLSGGTGFPADVSRMQYGLTQMRTRISRHNSSNRELLSRRVDQLRVRMSKLRIPNRHLSPFAAAAGPQMVDIQG